MAGDLSYPGEPPGVGVFRLCEGWGEYFRSIRQASSPRNSARGTERTNDRTPGNPPSENCDAAASVCPSFKDFHRQQPDALPSRRALPALRSLRRNLYKSARKANEQKRRMIGETHCRLAGIVVEQEAGLSLAADFYHGKQFPLTAEILSRNTEWQTYIPQVLSPQEPRK